MSTYGLEKVIEMWGVGKLTTEQAIGQILQLICEDRERMNEIERRLKKVEERERASQTRPALDAARDEPDEGYLRS